MGLGSGIRKKPIPDPGSRGKKVTGYRIRNTDNKPLDQCGIKFHYQANKLKNKTKNIAGKGL